MPLHDWTRVSAGTYHYFHTSWIIDLSRLLNQGILPPDYYAMGEQIAEMVGPDILTLQATYASSIAPCAAWQAATIWSRSWSASSLVSVRSELRRESEKRSRFFPGPSLLGSR